MQQWLQKLRQSENQLALALSLIIGAVVGLVVVAFILLTGRLAANDDALRDRGSDAQSESLPQSLRLRPIVRGDAA